ncbi:unnamed protein product [Pleuronectes platessa]|uniref:Uncharacterized protein n=1 Tax=Pleuronectes platessa TaxID=8262 RepID=A0A9N7YCU7_PLEPL|nr:unnamed protein product [Pleuronectes platessa]
MLHCHHSGPPMTPAGKGAEKVKRSSDGVRADLPPDNDVLCPGSVSAEEAAAAAALPVSPVLRWFLSGGKLRHEARSMSSVSARLKGQFP